ncbi:hypothetical protein NNRS527_01900 [Nitrosospira sp. NRS527]|nr:hypothetical protein NNRS527_01900 [Nitrosospira sp. NRS527]
MSMTVWPRLIPEDASNMNGIVYFHKEEEEPFTSDIVSRHPDCLAEPMTKEYTCLYVGHGKEQAAIQSTLS